METNEKINPKDLSKWPQDWEKHLLFAAYSYFNEAYNDLNGIAFNSSLIVSDKEKKIKQLVKCGESLIVTMTLKDIIYVCRFIKESGKIVIDIRKMLDYQESFIQPSPDNNCFPSGQFSSGVEKIVGLITGKDPLEAVQEIEKKIWADYLKGDDNDDNTGFPTAPISPSNLSKIQSSQSSQSPQSSVSRGDFKSL